MIEQTYNRHASGHGPGITGGVQLGIHEPSHSLYFVFVHFGQHLTAGNDEMSNHKDVNPS
jgi:hypothetical protein